jgi:DNA-binding NtrC family response regulator
MTRILVADSDPSVRQCLFAVLRSRGYEVRTATSGNEVLRLHAKEAFELIILDLLMPERDGLDAIAELQRRSPQTRILATSGQGSIGFVDLLYVAEKFGAHAILAKPFSAKKLLDTVESLLKERVTESQHLQPVR